MDGAEGTTLSSTGSVESKERSGITFSPFFYGVAKTELHRLCGVQNTGADLVEWRDFKQALSFLFGSSCFQYDELSYY